MQIEPAREKTIMLFVSMFIFLISITGSIIINSFLIILMESVKKGDQITNFFNLKLSPKVIIIFFFSKFNPKLIYLSFLLVIVFIFLIALLCYYINYSKIPEKEYSKIINNSNRSQKLNNII